MITEDYVSFEIAKLLKDKGFEGKMHTFYTEEGTEMESAYVVPSNFFPIYRPTLQMAMKWLKEVHNLYVTSVPNGIGEDIFYPHVYKKFEWGWTVLDSSMNGFQDTEFSSPEEACEAAIKYCIENLI